MLRQDFELNLGAVEGELPRDDAGLDVTAVWKAVGHAIKDIKGWEVTEDVVLSMFSFAKYLMWKDLAEDSEQLRENPVVRHLLDTPRDAYPPGARSRKCANWTSTSTPSRCSAPCRRIPRSCRPCWPPRRARTSC